MARRVSVEDRIREVRLLRDESDHSAMRAAVAKALADSSNLVVAEGAKLIADFELGGFESDLRRAYERFLAEPLKTDKGCFAKAAIVDALGRLSYDDPEFYRAGMAYSQVEPGWPSEDTAHNVRGACAFALARSHQLRAVTKLLLFVELLDSKSRLDRVHAAQAIADTGNEAALPVLKLKLLSGDEHADVLGACMAGMLRLNAAEAVPMVAACLDGRNEDVVVEAAAALGETGRDDAIDPLIRRSQRESDHELLRSLLASIGLTRNARGVAHLLAKIEANDRDSELALAALRPVAVYAEIRGAIEAAVGKTGNARLRAMLVKL